MENLIPISEITELLQDRRIGLVAKKSGLSYPTVNAVAKGSDNISIKTWSKLSLYFSPPIGEE